MQKSLVSSRTWHKRSLPFPPKESHFKERDWDFFKIIKHPLKQFGEVGSSWIVSLKRKELSQLRSKKGVPHIRWSLEDSKKEIGAF
eukprot:c22229_g1_i1 orf=674-931(-)